MAEKIDLTAFLTAANERARTRLFTEQDFQQFMLAQADARKASRKRQSFYRTDDAGGVANAYKHMTTTAQWAVWLDPQTRKIVTYVGRTTVFGRTVPCPFYGGERGYHKAWKDARKAEASKTMEVLP